ncbi:MAG TPA: HAD hydrolase-like protein [Casimicrobiaceae bacterium]|jgi:phosphoglycolate phosphatase
MIGDRALLFDLDGTLTDNYTGIAASIRYALSRLDAPIPSDSTLKSCVGPRLRESFARLLGNGDPIRVESAIVHYRERFADIGWRENMIYDGVADLLAALAATGQRLFVCTAKPEIFARRIVTHFGIAPCFHGVYGADLSGAFDDKAVLLRRALDREQFRAGDAIMIGDHGNDIRAAHENGLCAIGVLWGYGSREELADADALAVDTRDLARLLAGEIDTRTATMRAAQSSKYL